MPAFEENEGGSAADLVTAAERYYAEADLEQAERAFKMAIGAGASEVLCRQYLARIFDATQKLPEALAEWRRLTALEPTQVEPALQVARILRQQGDLVEAAAAYEHALQLAPGHTEALLSLIELRRQHKVPRVEPVARRPSTIDEVAHDPGLEITVGIKGRKIRIPLSDRSAREHARSWVIAGRGYQYTFDDHAPPGYLRPVSDAPDVWSEALRIDKTFEASRTICLEREGEQKLLSKGALLIVDAMQPQSEAPSHRYRLRLDRDEGALIIRLSQDEQLLRLSVRLVGSGHFDGLALRALPATDALIQQKHSLAFEQVLPLVSVNSLGSSVTELLQLLSEGQERIASLEARLKERDTAIQQYKERHNQHSGRLLRVSKAFEAQRMILDRSAVELARLRTMVAEECRSSLEQWYGDTQVLLEEL
jgi:tetratricopeptide (TPR) repeat protein